MKKESYLCNFNISVKCIVLFYGWLIFTSTSFAMGNKEKIFEALYQQDFFTDKIQNFIFIKPSSGLTEDEFLTIKHVFPAAVEKTYRKATEPYLANDDIKRFLELKDAIYCKDKKYIWATLGGYGSARLFDKLKMLNRPKNPKIFIGYSDVTFLHLFFHKWGWKSIHGAMPFDVTNKNIDRKNFLLIAEILKNSKGTICYKGLKSINELASKTRWVTGKMIGGNLTLLANSLGTDWQLDGNNKIIFIEDIGSNGYVIDRDLMHLKQAGIFKNAKAILFGKFVGGDQNVQYAIKKFSNSMHIPVFYADFFGHGNSNYPLPFGFLTSLGKRKNDDSFTLKVNYNFSGQ